MEPAETYKYVKCCACDGELTNPPFLVQIPVTITWESPKWGNFITGAKDQGVGFLCSTCANTKGFDYTRIRRVVEFFSGNGVKYHPITWVIGQNNRLIAQLT